MMMKGVLSELHTISLSLRTRNPQPLSGVFTYICLCGDFNVVFHPTPSDLYTAKATLPIPPLQYSAKRFRLGYVIPRPSLIWSPGRVHATYYSPFCTVRSKRLPPGRRRPALLGASVFFVGSWHLLAWTPNDATVCRRRRRCFCSSMRRCWMELTPPQSGSKKG